MSNLPPQVPIENALDNLSLQMNEISDICSILPGNIGNWKLYKQPARDNLTAEFKELVDFIESKITNCDASSLVQQIQTVSTILGQVALRVSRLDNELNTK